MRTKSVLGTGAAWRYAAYCVSAIVSGAVAPACVVDLGAERSLSGPSSAGSSSSSSSAASGSGGGWGVGLVTRHDCDGVEVSWALQIGSEGHEVARALAPDGQGGVFVTGGFKWKLDLGGYVLQSAGERDNFVARIDSDGNPLWARRFGDSADQLSWALAAAPGGDVLIFGGLNGAIDFGNGAVEGDMSDAFIARYDAMGGLRWTKVYSGLSYQSIADLVVDPVSGDLFIAGLFHETMKIGADTWTSTGDADAFVARLDDDGNYIWGRPMRGTAADYAFGLAFDGLNRILVGGWADDDIDLGEGTYQYFGDDKSDAWAGLYDAANGAPVWTRLWSAPQNQSIRHVTFDSKGTPVVAGRFEEHLKFDAKKSTDNLGVFVAQLDDAGKSTEVAVITNARDVTSLVPRANRRLLLTGYWGSFLKTTSPPAVGEGSDEGMLVKLDGSLSPTSTIILASPESDDFTEVAVQGEQAYAFGTFRETTALSGCPSLTSVGDADMVLLKLAQPVRSWISPFH